MQKEKLIDIIDDLLMECENDLFEFSLIEDEKTKIIFENVKLFALKLKEKIVELEFE